MQKIDFYDEETGEKIIFNILSAVQYKEEGYLLVADEDEMDGQEDLTVYVLKATYIEGDDVVYVLEEDDALLDIVYPLLEANLDQFEN